MATFVLVHGGGHGAWCWDRLAPLLRAAGHEVHVPTLTGVGERAGELTPQVDLSTHIADVVRVFEDHDLRDAILIGHSYGGTVITGVAGQVAERIAELVFLDAPHTRHGESLCDASPGMGERIEEHSEVVDGIRLTLFPTPGVMAAFGIDDPEDIAWALPLLTPHPVACFTEKLNLADEAAVLAIPRTSIDCTPTLSRRDAAMNARARSSDRTFEIDTGHDLMITKPREVADILLAIAADHRPGG